MRELILASASPRRKEILANLGLSFQVVVADIDESRREQEMASDYVVRLAMRKALTVADMVGRGIVIAADTIVVVDEQVLGKPGDEEAARNMLRTLSGREHVVFTGVGVVDTEQGKTISGREQTIVYFRRLSEQDIEGYLTSGEPFDKAGGYGIQGRGALLVRKIEGDYFNVMGLPVSLLHQLLLEVGVNILSSSL